MVYRRSPLRFCSLCNAPHPYSQTHGCRGCVRRKAALRESSAWDRSTWSTCSRCGEAAPLASRHPRSICTACATAMTAQRRQRGPVAALPKPPARIGRPPKPPAVPPAVYTAARQAVDEARTALAQANAARRAAREAATVTARTWHEANAEYRRRCRLYAAVCRGALPFDPTA